MEVDSRWPRLPGGASEAAGAWVIADMAEAVENWQGVGDAAAVVAAAGHEGLVRTRHEDWRLAAPTVCASQLTRPVNRENPALKLGDLPLWLLGDATVEGLHTNIPPAWSKDNTGRSTSGYGQYDGNCSLQ